MSIMKLKMLFLSIAMALATTSCSPDKIDGNRTDKAESVVIPNPPHTPIPDELTARWQMEGEFRGGIDVNKFWNYGDSKEWFGYKYSNGSSTPYRITERKMFDFTDATGKKAKLYIYWQDYQTSTNEYRAESLLYVEGTVSVRDGQFSFHAYGGNIRERKLSTDQLTQRSFTKNELKTLLTDTFKYSFPANYTPPVMHLTNSNPDFSDYFRKS
ncbi:hypothetical protein [Streptomyces chryseus]